MSDDLIARLRFTANRRAGMGAGLTPRDFIEWEAADAIATERARADAAENALVDISIALGGTREWTDQPSMIGDVLCRVRDERARAKLSESEFVRLFGECGGSVNFGSGTIASITTAGLLDFYHAIRAAIGSTDA